MASSDSGDIVYLNLLNFGNAWNAFREDVIKLLIERKATKTRLGVERTVYADENEICSIVANTNLHQQWIAGRQDVELDALWTFSHSNDLGYTKHSGCLQITLTSRKFS